MPSADASFLPLFLAHQPALYAFVLANGIAPADADDVIQNVAVVLWQRYAEFRPGSDFRAWAYAVTRLELRKQGDRWRRDQRVLRLPDAVLDRIEAAGAAGPEWEHGRLQQCLSRLGEQARNLVTLHYAEGLPQAEIARRLGISHEAVRTRLSRIRRAVQSCLIGGATQGQEPA